jgi:membrane-bound acyltransferase YfiQ involved in biofilm formation
VFDETKSHEVQRVFFNDGELCFQFRSTLASTVAYYLPQFPFSILLIHALDVDVVYFSMTSINEAKILL